MKRRIVLLALVPEIAGVIYIGLHPQWSRAVYQSVYSWCWQNIAPVLDRLTGIR